MKEKKVTIKKGKKNITLVAKHCNFFERGRGLTWRRVSKAPILLFDYEKPSREALTGLMVFFEFLVLWLDSNNRVLEMKTVRPFAWHVNIGKAFSKVIEIPFHPRYRREIDFFLGSATAQKV